MATNELWPAGVADAYRATTTPKLVDVPELAYLMIDGVGDPAGSAEYTDAVAATPGGSSPSHSIGWVVRSSASWPRRGSVWLPSTPRIE
jgi:hypothetical protein